MPSSIVRNKLLLLAKPFFYTRQQFRALPAISVQTLSTCKYSYIDIGHNYQNSGNRNHFRGNEAFKFPLMAFAIVIANCLKENDSAIEQNGEF